MSAGAGSPGAPERLDFLDGTRGWASLMVVLSHVWGHFARHVCPVYDQPLLRAISDGHLAVLIFFVLSGVALSLRFVRRPQRVALVQLVAARYVRLIVPIAAVTMIVYLMIAFHVSGSAEAARLARSDIFLGARHDMTTTFGQAVSFAFYKVLFAYDHHTSFDASLWTIPIEFLGSILIYLLLFAFSRVTRLGRRHRIALSCALCVALVLLSKQMAACFAAGYVVAELTCITPSPARQLRWVALACMAIAVALIIGQKEMTDTNGGLLALGIVMTGAFWSGARRALSSAPSRWVGRISFPLYLIHVPVIGSAGLLFAGLVHRGLTLTAATHLTVAIVVPACLLAAWLLLPVEAASIRWSRAVGALGRRVAPAKQPAPVAGMLGGE